MFVREKADREKAMVKCTKITRCLLAGAFVDNFR